MPAQISASRPLQPDPASLRGTPIAAVLLTNADLDHTLGLVSLREGGKLNIYATRAVREAVDICPGVTAIMETFGRVTWSEPADKLTALRGADGTESSVHFRAIDLPGKAPKFAQEIGSNGRHSVAYQLVDRRTGGRLLIAPDVAGINDGLRTALSDSDAVLFDGTFWSADELGRVKDGASSADEMGHMTIKDGSLALLKSLTAARKIYIHINNTNPILAPGSPERAAVEAAGIVAGFDGMEFEL